MNIGDNKEFKKMIESKGLTGNIFDANLFFQNKKITSLKGMPKKVNGSFDCSNNELTSLEFGPKIVNKNFYCNNNKLKSLNSISLIILFSINLHKVCCFLFIFFLH